MLLDFDKLGALRPFLVGLTVLVCLFLILPITSPLAFIYLASSGEAPAEEKPKKYVSSSMTFDTA